MEAAPMEIGEAEEEQVTAPNGVIRFEIDNVSKLDENGRYSPEIELEGMTWEINVSKRKEKDEECLSTALFVTSQSMLWSIELYQDITLFHPDITKNRVQSTNLATFNANTGWGTTLMNWNEFINNDKGFITDDKITVEVHFWITQMTGIRRIPRIDFSSPDHSSIALIIEGEKIYVDKQILALYSPVFNSMFYSNFAEKNMEEIELKDIDREEFMEVLHQIYPTHKKITDEIAESLLKLADRFQIKKVIERVEKFLIDDSKLDVPAKLIICEQYRLAKLQEHCLGNFKTIEDNSDKECTIDFFDPNEPRHDVALVINGEKIFASKQYLSLHSPWFFSKIWENNELEIDVDREEFLEMLRVIYPSYGKITDVNVNFLLKLAERFEIKLLFDLAEDHLITSTIPDLVSKLLLSDQYTLNKLQDNCISRLHSIEQVRELEKTAEYRKLSDKTARALLHRIFRLVDWMH